MGDLGYAECDFESNKTAQQGPEYTVLFVLRRATRIELMGNAHFL